MLLEAHWKDKGEDSCKYVPADIWLEESCLLMKKGRIKEIKVSDGGSDIEIVDSRPAAFNITINIYS